MTGGNSSLTAVSFFCSLSSTGLFSGVGDGVALGSSGVETGVGLGDSVVVGVGSVFTSSVTTGVGDAVATGTTDGTGEGSGVGEGTGDSEGLSDSDGDASVFVSGVGVGSTFWATASGAAADTGFAPIFSSIPSVLPLTFLYSPSTTA